MPEHIAAAQPKPMPKNTQITAIAHRAPELIFHPLVETDSYQNLALFAFHSYSGRFFAQRWRYEYESQNDCEKAAYMHLLGPIHLCSSSIILKDAAACRLLGRQVFIILLTNDKRVVMPRFIMLYLVGCSTT